MVANVIMAVYAAEEDTMATDAESEGDDSAVTDADSTEDGATSESKPTARLDGSLESSLYYLNEAKPDTWVFTDDLGRVSVTNKDVGDPRDDKTVAIFYWDWHEKLGKDKTALNATEVIKQYPEAKNDYDHPAWQQGYYCFWNEPIYGYYKTADRWVLRRQAELLANAGVDVIFNDNTNGNELWPDGLIPLWDTWEEAIEDGVASPKISFVFPFGDSDATRSQIHKIYAYMYESGKHSALWYYHNGKPLVMGLNNSPDLKYDVKEFFNWKKGQPSYAAGNSTDYWGWLSIYPQACYYANGMDMRRDRVEQMTVGVAVNYDYERKCLTAMNGENVMGRSYTSTYPDRYEKEGDSATLWGYQFSEQFDYALEKDPKVLFITGWNEWHAWRQQSWEGISNALADQFTDEFSRDIEPTKGALKDNYYYLMVNYIRKYKGCEAIPTPTEKVTIDIDGDIDQWASIGPYFSSYIGNTDDRDHGGYGTLQYTETSGRNDIIGSQVARDDENLYFLVECAENITPYTDDLWMTLYIDVDQEKQGWETFDYVVNKSSASRDTLVLERFRGNDSYDSSKVADVEYKVNGRYMIAKIAKSELGISGDDYTVNFAWTDNVHDEGDYTKFSGDIMDFYISGDVAPGGRFKYSYISEGEKAEETTTEQATTEQEATAESATPEVTQTESEEATTELSDEAAGCKAAAGALAAFISMLGASLVIKRKR